MSRNRKKLNLSLDEELLKFAKQWSYVTQKPISRLIDNFLKNLRSNVLKTTPEIWFDRESYLAGDEQKKNMKEFSRRWKEFF